MTSSDEDRSRSRRLGAEDRRWSSTGRVLGGRMIVRSNDAMCGLHGAQGDEEHGFLGLASKLRSMVSPGLASKLVATILVVWPQNRQLQFGDLAHKITMIVFWFVPQNQVGYGLSVVPQNRCEDEDSAGHTLRSTSLLRLEESWARVS
jgi:hypothetical protein